MVWALDLDGVVWLAHAALPGAVEAVAALQQRGDRVLFVTNNSFARRVDVADALRAIGIEPEPDAVVTSAMAAATLVEPGETVLLCAGPGARDELERRGVTVVDDGPADAVVVGFHRDFDYERMRIASTAVRDGARLIATNDDATYPTPDGVIPGGGSILASIVTASGATPTIAGKPYATMAAFVRDLAGPGPGVMVGDRHDTDGLLAARLGYRFALVLSGVTSAEEAGGLDPAPDLVADDLAGAVATLAG